MTNLSVLRITKEDADRWHIGTLDLLQAIYQILLFLLSEEKEETLGYEAVRYTANQIEDYLKTIELMIGRRDINA